LPTVNPIQLVPRRALPRPDLAARLQTLIDQCETVPLRHFLGTVFSERSFSQAFLTLPASQSHHHAYPGGLAEHSLEVAHLLQTVVAHEEPAMANLTAVAGLLHDVGKIALLKENGARTRAGFVLRHDTLTLELLAPALANLDALWPDGATALRYLLTWQPSGQDRRPLLPAALALQFADRYSSAHGARERAFAGAPDWKRFARLDTAGPISRFWRPDTTQAISTHPAALVKLRRDHAS
jgi:3'-5' exoribonuclease